MSESEKRMLNVRIDERMMLALADRANDEDVTVSEVVRGIIDRGWGIVRGANGFAYSKYASDEIEIPTSRDELIRLYRYFAESDMSLAEDIDFIADAGLRFEVECDDADRDRMDDLRNRLKLDAVAQNVMRELGIIGEAFVKMDILCQDCDGEDAKCLHDIEPCGMVSGVRIFDPALVLVNLYPATGSKFFVSNRETSNVDVFSDLSVIHVKDGVAYEPYGTSMIKPMLPMLMSKDANPRSSRNECPPQRDNCVPKTVLMCRISMFRNLTASCLEKIFNKQADIWRVKHVRVSWADDPGALGRDEHWLWNVAKGWRQGDVSDDFFARAIGATIAK